MKKISVWAVAVCALFVGQSANAAFELRLDDTGVGVGPELVITDNGAGDLNPTLGAILQAGPVGGFIVSTQTGVGSPIFNSGMIDLNSIEVTGASGGTLVIELVQSDLVGTFTGYNLLIGGTTTGSITWEFFADPGNSTDLSSMTLLHTMSQGTAGAFSDSYFAGSPTVNSPFSVAIRATVTHVGAGSTSFDASLQSVPEPGTMILWGSFAAMGVPAAIRRRFKTAA